MMLALDAQRNMEIGHFYITLRNGDQTEEALMEVPEWITT